ncbi:MAG: hypothetical protein WD065_13525 [Planctomycetaceae bacterium]
MQVNDVEQSWLRRVVDVHIGDKSYVIEYNGRGFGFETVNVNGKIASRATSWFWFVPHFDFEIDSIFLAIDVRVGLPLIIRSFVLTIENNVVYEE